MRGEEKVALRGKKKSLLAPYDFVCHNCRVLLTFNGYVEGHCFDISRCRAASRNTESYSPNVNSMTLRNPLLHLFLERVITYVLVSQADFRSTAMFHFLFPFVGSCYVLRVD